nr:N-6 DNA methylase [Curtobacterium pusillum]
MSSKVCQILGVSPADENILEGLTIGELGVVYEALLADQDHKSRKEAGQFFTPDDVAEFMAQHLSHFGRTAKWLDPCCGVGNLSWHLAAAHGDAARDFVANQLILVDQDETALRTAVVILAISFLSSDDDAAVDALKSRAQYRDFLSPEPLPSYDYAIMNPPYARSAPRPDFATSNARDLYAYFLERIEQSARGFIAITPASFLSGAKFQTTRALLETRAGGDVYVFDNVPDTCFRGFKYGSKNTSRTNFVRAAIIVSAPAMQTWRTTPILRWAFRSRETLFASAKDWLSERFIGPGGAWAKVMPSTAVLWNRLSNAGRHLGDLITITPTAFRLDVASTPRYYISASSIPLQRASKHVLYFETEADFEQAYLLLNSTLPYWWWRTIAGGISLSRHTLLTVPIPDEFTLADLNLVEELRASDRHDRTIKINAGIPNENVKRPSHLTHKVNMAVIGKDVPDFSYVYSSDMFALR